MQIQSIQNYNLNKQNTNFKSVYPTTYWIKNITGHFEPELNKFNAKEMNEIVIRMLNLDPKKIVKDISKLSQELEKLIADLPTIKNINRKTAKEKKINELTNKINKLKLTQRVQLYMTRADETYANNPIARGFYNPKGNYKENAAYIATGHDALYFENLGKKIGLARRTKDTVAIENAKDEYYTKGLEHAKNRAKNFKTKDGVPQELHVKMPITRKNKEIEHFDILDMHFFPKNSNNPFVSSIWQNK